MKHWFIYLTLLALSACSKELELTTSFLKSSGLGGTITPLNGIVLQQNKSHGLIEEAYAVTCDSNVYARLYAIEANGSLNSQPLLSTQVTSGRYEFPKNGLPSNTTSKVKYQVMIEGCDQYLSRPVTSFDKKQNVTYGSSLVGLATQATLNKPISQTEAVEVKALIDSLDGTSVLDAYTTLSGAPALTSKFTATFADVPSKLLDSYPSVALTSFPTMGSEGLATSFQVGSQHFDSSYTTAYEWHLNGVEQSTAAGWNYIPTANASGNYTVTLFIGKDEGTNHVDRTKPFYTTTRTIQIMDTIPATAPDFTIDVPYTRNGNISLKVLTGPGLENCDSFSTFLITDSLSTPGASDSGFSRTCSNDPEQIEAYSFSGTDGTKTISIWAKDASGQVSLTPKTFSVLYDSVLPSVSLSGLSPKYGGGTSASFTYSASDAGSGLASVELHFSSAGSAFAKVKDLSLGGTADSMVLPAVNVTDGILKIVAIDNAGNLREVSSSSIIIDSAPPTAPIVTLASAAYTNSQSVSLNVTCTGITDVLIGESVTAGDSTGWVPCTASMNTTLANTTQGTHGIKVFARDDVGNVSPATTVNLTYDSTNPTATITSHPSSLSSESTYNFQFAGSDNLTSAGSLIYQCSLNGGAFASCSSPSTRSGFVTGTNSFSVRSIDLASNVSADTTYSWSYDNSQPTISFTDVTSLTPAISNSLSARSVTISGTNVTTYKYAVIRSGACSAVDYSALSEITLAGNTTISFTPTTDGTYQICAIGKSSFNVWQLAANASSSPVLTIDTAAPTLAGLVLTPSQFNTSLTPSVAGTTKVSSTVTLHLNSPTCATAAVATTVAHASTGVFSVTASALSTDNDYNYYVKATDSAGNTICSSALPYTLDRTAPAISIVSLSGGQVIKGAQATPVTWTASDLNLTATPITIEFSLNGGANWTQIASTIGNSGTYSWNLPGYNSTTARVRITAVDKAGNTDVETSANFTIDSSAPILTLNTLTGGQVIRGGSAQAINWTASDNNTSGNWIALSYSTDSGATWTSIASTTNTGSYSWTAPSVNSSNYRVRIVATDSVGQTTTVTSASNITIDSTAPTISLTSFNGGEAILGDSYQAITWTAADTNFSASPISIELSSDSGSTWNSIASNLPNTGSYSWQASVPDATTYRVRVRATDAAGQSTMSASAANFTVSTQAPKISQTTLASPYYSNTVTSVTFGGACDDGYPINVTGAQTTTLTCTSGTWSWTTATQSTDGIRNYTFTQTNAVLTLAVTSRWVRDTVAPVLTAVSINNGNTTTARSLVSVKVTNSESGIKTRMANAANSTATCQGIYADNNWQNQTSTATTFSHLLSSEDGDKKVCVWLKDNAGNVSVISPATGDPGVDTDLINLSAGNTPKILSFSVINDGGGDFQGTTNANASDPLKISWNVTDVEGLDNNPIALDYTTDGLTWTPIEAAYGSLGSTPTTYTSDYAGFSAPVSTFFRVRIRVTDKAGNTSDEVFSKSFNTSPWSVYAGSTGRGDGGSGKSASIRLNSQGALVFAIHPKNNDIYFIDADSGLKKISASTGLVTRLTSAGTHSFSTSGTLSLSNRVTPRDTMFFDKNGFLYLVTGGSNSTASATQGRSTKKILKINPEDNSYFTYMNGGSAFDNTGTPSNTFILWGSVFAFDESNSLYFLANCTPGTWVDNTSTARLMKVTQKEDGTAGTVSVVAGNCVRGNPTSGNNAITTPFTTYNDPWYAGITVWNNGANIYVKTSSSIYRKIINGKIYSTAITTPSGGGRVVYSPLENLLYVSDGFIKVYSVNTAGANGEVEDTSKALLGTVSGVGCELDGTLATNGCFKAGQIFLTENGKMFFVDGATGSLVQLRYIDDAGKIQTLAGLKSFSGDNKDASLAKGAFSGIYYKKATEALSTVYKPGLYFLEREGGVLGYFDESTNLTKNLWGNQSGTAAALTLGSPVSPGLSIGSTGGNVSGDVSAFTFDILGRPWIRVEGSSLITIDENKQVLPRHAVTTNLWQNAADGANPASFSMRNYGGTQNLTLLQNKLFLIGVYYNPAGGFTDPNPRIKLFDYDNSLVTHIMGGVAPNVTPQQTTPGSLQNSALPAICQNTGCSIEYLSAQDRLYIAEDTKLRYIANPSTPASHTLIDVFDAGTTISNFTISPDRKYVIYLKSGAIYCHAFSASDNSAICNNNPANHINLGPPAGLSAITRGANQFTWKNNSTLYVSTYEGEIYEYILYHTP